MLPDAIETPPSVSGPTFPKTKAARDIEARAAAEAFESLFLSQFVEQMFKGIATDGPFSGGSPEGHYRSMLNEQMAKALARSGGIGLADVVYKEILKFQEV